MKRSARYRCREKIAADMNVPASAMLMALLVTEEYMRTASVCDVNCVVCDVPGESWECV